MAKKLEKRIENESLTKALKIIDPSGTLVPGTRQHNRISSMIREWIDHCGPGYAIEMAQIGATHLERWRKFL